MKLPGFFVLELEPATSRPMINILIFNDIFYFLLRVVKCFDGSFGRESRTSTYDIKKYGCPALLRKKLQFQTIERIEDLNVAIPILASDEGAKDLSTQTEHKAPFFSTIMKGISRHFSNNELAPSLPNLHPHIIRTVHAITRLHVIGLVKFWHVG
jgi:hypothetical protein